MTRPLRIIGITSALLAGVSALGWRAGQPDVLPLQSAPEPWVPLPRTGTTATSLEGRWQLIAALEQGGAGSLVRTCGSRRGDPRDQYRLELTKDRFFTERRQILVQIESPDRIMVSVQALHPASWDHVPAAPVTTVTLPWSALEPLRRTWRESPIWNGPERFMCTHSRWLTMEACIDGAYALRQSMCESGLHDAYDALWEVATRTLPPPPAPPWDPFPPPPPSMR